MFEVKRNSRNIQEIHLQFNSQKDTRKLLLLSDIHFDNPHCDRELLKKDLDKALEDDAGICIFGDLFCCMMGNYDPRKVKGNLMPCHDGPNYFDLVVEEAVEWWRPYANNLILVCPGNHETAIMKRQEIDLIDRFTTMLRIAEPDCNVSAGGYGNWMRVFCSLHNARNSFTIYSHHGYGSGGAFSQQITAFQKYFMQCDADVYIAGHIHKKGTFPIVRSMLNQSMKIKNQKIDMIRCGTYKDEFIDGAEGWAVEKGMGPRPMGGYWMEISVNRDSTINRKIYET
mgnify:FL=1